VIDTDKVQAGPVLLCVAVAIIGLLAYALDDAHERLAVAEWQAAHRAPPPACPDYRVGGRAPVTPFDRLTAAQEEHERDVARGHLQIGKHHLSPAGHGRACSSAATTTWPKV